MHQFLFPLYFYQHPIGYCGLSVDFYPIEKNLTKITLLDYKGKEIEVLSRGEGENDPLIRTKEGINAFVNYFNQVNELHYVNCIKTYSSSSKTLYIKNNLVIEGHPFWAFHDLLHLIYDICSVDINKKDKINLLLEQEPEQPILVLGHIEFKRHVETLAAFAILIKNEKYRENKAIIEFFNNFFHNFDIYSFLKNSAYLCSSTDNTEEEIKKHNFLVLSEAIENIYGQSNVFLEDLTDPYHYTYKFAYLDESYCFRKKIEFTKRLIEDFSSVIGV